ncbi:unnamed protein product [Polarella glacialis]|uniref:Uncharacterized protein n=1 Tax=Polarella glacialis TaxID=89957 RepID=A0A813GH70_POLGL|nr:unnamed protein product [Polarella glacialis]
MTPMCGELAGFLRHSNPAFRITGQHGLRALKQHSSQEVAAAVAKQLPILEEQVSTITETLEKSAAAKTMEVAEVNVKKRCVLDTLAQFKELSAPHGRAIAECLSDPDRIVRGAAIRALIESGPAVVPHALKPLRKRLEHDDPNVRRSAVDCLRGLAPLHLAVAGASGRTLQEGGAAATRAAEGEKLDRAVLDAQKQALLVLGGAGKHAKNFLPDIARELENPDFQVRRGALECLVDLKEHAASAAMEIAKRLLHADPVVRRTAVETLGRMAVHGADVMDRVKGLARDEKDEDVLTAIKVAMGAAKAQ